MKQFKIIILITILLVLVAGAAFMAARMWAAAPAERAESGGGRMLQIAGGGKGPQHFNLDIEPAPELPQRPAEVEGIFVRREDDNIFVGTGNIQVRMEVDSAGGKPSMTTSHEGPVVEVVVNRDTLIYQDTTPLNFEPGSVPEGDHKVQQIIQPAESLEGLGESSEIQVWGERRGDRVVAEVFVFRSLLVWSGGK